MEIRLSSHKNGNGLKELISSNLSEFWHTDENLPHFINIQFTRPTFVEKILLCVSFTRDDTYTPECLEIWSGTIKDDVCLQSKYELCQPEGEIMLIVDKVVIYLTVVIKANHQEGRDSRVRMMKVYGEDDSELFPMI